MTPSLTPRVDVLGASTPSSARVLTPEALAFVAQLHRRFEGTRQELLRARSERQRRIDAGEMPDFLAAIHDNPAVMSSVVAPSGEGMSVTMKLR